MREKGALTSLVYSTLFNTAEVLSLDWLYSTEQLLLIGTEDGTVKLWNAANNRVTHEMTLEPSGYLPLVVDIACNPVSTSLFIASLSTPDHLGAQLV